MPLNRRYLNLTEALIDLIFEINDEAEGAIESLREFLEIDVDGFTSIKGEVLAYAVQSRLEEIWGLLNDEERFGNKAMVAFLRKFVARVERDSGYEADIDFTAPYVDERELIEAEMEDACDDEY